MVEAVAAEYGADEVFLVNFNDTAYLAGGARNEPLLRVRCGSGAVLEPSTSLEESSECAYGALGRRKNGDM